MRKWFSFDGRASRFEFWIGSIVLFALWFGVAEGTRAIFGEESTLGLLIALPIIFVIWLMTIMLQCRRWHDRDKSGLWILINFVPLIGSLWALIENGFLGGDQASNHFGPPPEAWSLA